MLRFFLILSLAWICFLHSTAVAQECDEEYDVASGSIVSAGYPVFPYGPNLDCYYTINVPTNTPGNTTIQFLVIDLYLELESDYLEIYDGPTIASLLIGRFTGQYSNYTLHTTSYQALIYFHTDSINEYKGFNIYFQSQELITECPGESYGDYGSIQSPNYPEQYSVNSFCQYLIKTPADSRINLHIDYIDIEARDKCIFDYLEIYDGPSINDTNLGKLCGSGPVNDILSTSNELLVYFYSDGSLTGGGFNISYSTDICQGPNEFTGSQGTIYSPGYPISQYPNGAHCGYTITTPLGSQVLVHINYIDLEYGESDCPYDFVRFYDGPNEDFNVLATYCGSNESGSMLYNNTQASSNQLYISFQSDISNSYSGFCITYIANYNTEVVD